MKVFKLIKWYQNKQLLKYFELCKVIKYIGRKRYDFFILMIKLFRKFIFYKIRKFKIFDLFFDVLVIFVKKIVIGKGKICLLL